MSDDSAEKATTTADVRAAFSDAYCWDPDDPAHEHGCPQNAVFDRWLAAHVQEVRAQAWDEGFEAGVDQESFDSRGLSSDPDAHTFPRHNPYRESEA